MELNEIEKEIERLEKMKAEALRVEKEKELQKGFEEAREILGRLASDCQRVYDLGYCPPRILEALKDTNGKFNPGMYIKRPKAPRDTKPSEA